MKFLWLCVPVLLLAACAVPTDSGAVAAGKPAPTVATSPAASSPRPTPATVPGSGGHGSRMASSDRPVTFSGLAPGTYPVHLHLICSGRQGFHLSYLPNLHVAASSVGTISVPAADFGRGWCVIVYTNQSLTTVLTTRRI